MNLYCVKFWNSAGELLASIEVPAKSQNKAKVLACKSVTCSWVSQTAELC